MKPAKLLAICAIPIVICIAISGILAYLSNIHVKEQPVKTHVQSSPTQITATSTVSTKDTYVEPEFKVDDGYVRIMDINGYGPELTADFYSPVEFQVKWRCYAEFGPHWLRIPVYRTNMVEYQDIYNGTCVPTKTGKVANSLSLWDSGETVISYPPGNYTVRVLSHVPQLWELLFEAKSLEG